MHDAPDLPTHRGQDPLALGEVAERQAHELVLVLEEPEERQCQRQGGHQGRRGQGPAELRPPLVGERRQRQ